MMGILAVNDLPAEWGGLWGVRSLQAGLTRRHLRASRVEKASVVAGAEEVSDSTKGFRSHPGMLPQFLALQPLT
jgi:hypothetical protein